jgi:hypothetical protein
MNGVDVIMSGSTSPPNEGTISPHTTADNVHVVDTLILASLSDRNPITKGRVNDNQLTIAKRKEFYD